jgi:hypothetical protein
LSGLRQFSRHSGNAAVNRKKWPKMKYILARFTPPGSPKSGRYFLAGNLGGKLAANARH